MTCARVVHRVEQWVTLDYVHWKRCARKRSWPTSRLKSKSSTVSANSTGNMSQIVDTAQVNRNESV